MKEGWEYKKLGDVCTKITDGSHNPPKGIVQSEFLMLSSQNVFNDCIDFKDVRFLCFEDFHSENKRTSVQKGDLLLTIVGTIGRCAVVNTDKNITLQRSVAVLTPNKSLISRYLMYCCIGNNKKFISNAHGIAQKGIYLKQLKTIEIPVPLLSEQQRIVEELDLLSSIIEKKKEQLKELDNLAQSIFYDMFGDIENNRKSFSLQILGEVCNLKAGKAIKADELHEKDETLYPCYGGNGIRGYIDHYSHSGNFPIIGRQGALCGNVNFASGDFYATEHAVVVTPLIEINTTWLFYLLMAMNLGQYAHGVAQPGLSVKDLQPLSIPLPPLSLQQQFAEKIEAIEKQKELIKQSIKEVETLFNSRMDYYFT